MKNFFVKLCCRISMRMIQRQRIGRRKIIVRLFAKSLATVVSMRGREIEGIELTMGG